MLDDFVLRKDKFNELSELNLYPLGDVHIGSKEFNMEITASGGVSALDDIKELRKMDIYGAIIGKAYYTGAIDLTEAIEAAK